MKGDRIANQKKGVILKEVNGARDVYYRQINGFSEVFRL